jgi:hypothetical protein
MKIGEISRVIPRKNGGYSIIQIIGNKKSVLQNFETVRAQVRDNYVAELTQRARTAWISELKRKYQVIFFENNLNYMAR